MQGVNPDDRPTSVIPGVPAQRECSSRERVRVLLVDDNADILQLLRATFAFHEHVRVCASAADGLEALSVWRALRPDVVVMDISMPAMTGIEAARCMLAEDPAARIALYSTRISAAQREQAAEMGVIACVDKRDFACLPELARQISAASRSRLAATSARLSG